MKTKGHAKTLLDMIALTGTRGMSVKEMQQYLWWMTGRTGVPSSRGFWKTNLYCTYILHGGLLKYYCDKVPGKRGVYVRNQRAHNGRPFSTMARARRAWYAKELGITLHYAADITMCPF